MMSAIISSSPASAFMPSAFLPLAPLQASSTPAVTMGWKFWKRSKEADAETVKLSPKAQRHRGTPKQQKAMEDQLEMHDDLIATL